MASHKPRTIDDSVLAALPLPGHDSKAGKADRGALLLVAGSRRLPGAAILAARAALRVGCGTARVAAPESVAVAIGVAIPELMVLPLPETGPGTAAEAAGDLLDEQVESCHALVVGPGLGEHEETDRLAVRLITGSKVPTVLDASALLAWGQHGRPGTCPKVLTPHVMETSRLTGMEAEAIDADREGLASRLAQEWASVFVLKGDTTLIAGEGLYRNTAGTPGLGTSGSGDVLAGVVGGLLARGADPTTAAVWGVHLHALAGEIAAEQKGDDGLTASDVVECLPEALRSLLKRV